MKKLLLATTLLTALAAAAHAETSPDQNGEEEKSCAVIYQGKTSRLKVCDDNSIDWTLPRDAFRIGKPFKPGPGAIIREAPDKIIRKPAAWVGKRLGIKW